MQLKPIIALIGFVILISADSISGQTANWDYEAYPWMPVEYRHLDAEIRINQEGLIIGDILYTLKIKDEQADSLLLDASGIEIIGVEVQNEPATYSITRDHLQVQLPQRYERKQTLSLRIQYRAKPDFGVHQTVNGTFFTSNLPKTTSHWLPVTDHPSVEFTSEFIFIHPASQEMVLNGRRGDQSVVSLDEEAVFFSINKPISPVGLNWAMGDLSLIQSSLSQEWQSSNPDLSEGFQGRSDPQIHLYSEVEAQQAEQILNEAANILKKIQDETGIAYPFRDLQIILLRDDFWETKPYGAGTIYLFMNREDLISQVRRSVISQWIGAKLRERQWTDADAILMLQAWQLFRTNSIPDTSRNTPEPYNTFDASQLGPWIVFFDSEPDMAIWNSKLMDVVNQLFLKGTYTLSYNE
ncbi:MAG: hypothetical protein R3345_13550, partial [Fulvivirga sp.]|nr:hypothetical protein [Fulvivirga sp.]